MCVWHDTNPLTHWSRIYVITKQAIIASDNGWQPGRRQVTISSNNGSFSITLKDRRQWIFYPIAKVFIEQNEFEYVISVPVF